MSFENKSACFIIMVEKVTHCIAGGFTGMYYVAKIPLCMHWIPYISIIE